MTIRFKITLALMLATALTTAATTAWFIQVQRRLIMASEAEKQSMLLQNAERMGRESLLARDPLLLLSYLSFVKKTNPELAAARVFARGEWLAVGGQAGSASPEPSSPPHEIEVSPDLKLQIWFDEEFLRKRAEAAIEASRRDALRFCAGATFAGIVLAALLAGSLTRRLTLIGNAMETVGEGNWGEALRITGRDEVAKLANVFNGMSTKLRELDEAKKVFVASVTHELRSPLGAIDSQLRRVLTGNEPLGSETRTSLQRIQENTVRLSHFVTNLLEMAKIQRGKLEYHPKTARLEELMEDAVLFYKPRALEAGITLAFSPPQDLPAVFIDPDLIRQVIVNFVSNGIKFTRPPGTITVSAKKEGARIVCSVTDTGVGLSPEAQKRIFQPFERVENPVKATGTGLGLAISKSIIELHRGEIGVESTPGAGSRFFFALPLAK